MAHFSAESPDYHDRLFYISGTHAMVTATETMLRRLGIPAKAH